MTRAKRAWCKANAYVRSGQHEKAIYWLSRTQAILDGERPRRRRLDGMDAGYIMLVGLAALESVSTLRQGLQSFRSMRRMEASFKNARALRLRFSQSLARRRQRLSQAIVRSTIQRLGNCTNPLA